jgi:catechol 2,3-dioxygenase-like lactoylglutathione lyase family enzyme
MLPNKLGVVMITVSDMDRSVGFYRDTLGLPLRFASPDWTEFATEGVTLALHGGGSPAQGAPPSGDPVIATIHTGWQVEDVDAVCAVLKERGVRFVREPTQRAEEGIRLAVFLDPDGCPLSVWQSL